jgi:hypothetical protein
LLLINYGPNKFYDIDPRRTGGETQTKNGQTGISVLLAGSTSTMVEHLTIKHEIKGLNPARHLSAVENGRERERRKIKFCSITC